MPDILTILAQAAATPLQVMDGSTKIWLSIGALILTFSTALFSTAKYILALKIEPIEARVNKLETTVSKLQHDLLQQVIEIAEANHKHRLEQQRQHTELRLLLSESYAKKEDLDKVMRELEFRTKPLTNLTEAIRNIERQLS